MHSLWIYLLIALSAGLLSIGVIGTLRSVRDASRFYTKVVRTRTGRVGRVNKRRKQRWA